MINIGIVGLGYWGPNYVRARNTAFKNAKNEIVAVLDADCVPEPDWLEKLMKNFTDKNIAGVGGKLMEKDTDTLADKWRAVHMKQHWGNERVVNPIVLTGSNNVFKKGVIEEIEYFNEKFKTNYEDMDICKRLKEAKDTLIYEPKAFVYHLRRDSVYSLLKAQWGWARFNELDFNNFKNVIKVFRAGACFSIEYAKKDIAQKRFSFLKIDFMVLIFYFYLSLKKYLTKE
jgi:cellulose synthase/poly-beta-1,6-N-acetylglucosamine synthase-like glycosyltransferase